MKVCDILVINVIILLRNIDIRRNTRKVNMKVYDIHATGVITVLQHLVICAHIYIFG